MVSRNAVDTDVEELFCTPLISFAALVDNNVSCFGTVINRLFEISSSSGLAAVALIINISMLVILIRSTEDRKLILSIKYETLRDEYDLPEPNDNLFSLIIAIKIKTDANKWNSIANIQFVLFLLQLKYAN